MLTNTESLRAKSGLSPSRRQLIALMQEIHFGRLERIDVRDADPVLTPRPEIVREIKFGGENGPGPERDTRVILAKPQIIDLFAQLDQVRNGRIETLEIKHGLPFRAWVREAAA